jgi:hypothetical protein
LKGEIWKREKGQVTKINDKPLLIDQ